MSAVQFRHDHNKTIEGSYYRPIVCLGTVENMTDDECACTDSSLLNDMVYFFDI